MRVDEMEKCGHYEHWRTDFELVEDLDIHFLRYGPPIHRTWLGHGRYDWEFADLTFDYLKSLDIMPIVDLCHFGVPDWIGDFQNPDFPALFAEYACAFAERYPWVQLYTPVNEMFICALFSARYGWWNEQLQSDMAFVTALKHIVKANVLAMARDPRSAAGRDLHPERVLGVLPRREPGRDQAGRDHERAPVPVARPQLRSPRQLGHVRVPARQRHDPGRVPLLPASLAPAPLGIVRSAHITSALPKDSSSTPTRA